MDGKTGALPFQETSGATCLRCSGSALASQGLRKGEQHGGKEEQEEHGEEQGEQVGGEEVGSHQDALPAKSLRRAIDRSSRRTNDREEEQEGTKQETLQQETWSGTDNDPFTARHCDRPVGLKKTRRSNHGRKPGRRRFSAVPTFRHSERSEEPLFVSCQPEKTRRDSSRRSG
jgi:hypothetical protein